MSFKLLIIQAVFSAAFLQVISQSMYDQIEVTTVLKERFFDKNGSPLTGKGVVVGDVDSGIDIFHPMFFFADGGEFSWTDVNGDGFLTFGTDGIDLNNDNVISLNEILRYIEIKDGTWGMLPGSDPKKYNPEYDFVYIDANENKVRDFGPKNGFRETDPSYGEQFLISIDENKNGKIEAGEKLNALKTSKVKAVRERDGTVKRRGVDLINCEPDSSGHGTGVAGLIIGGHYGVQKIHGIAPDAEIIIASVRYNYTPRFVTNFPDLFGFLRDEKVNILLIEDGEWMHEFMDGSSPEEEILNQMARDGVTIVGGAGNMTTGNMVLIDTLSPGRTYSYMADCSGSSENVKINNGVFFSFLWNSGDAKLSFTIESPDGKKSDELTDVSGAAKVGNYNVNYAKEISPKGTNMFRFSCSRTDSGLVKGKWKIKVNTTGSAVIWGYVVDVTQSWSGSARWVNSPAITDESNVCFPSTADSCIAVAAYVVNFGWFDRVGDIANYSSRGYNITGKLGIDITGPGHSTITCEKDLYYQVFSGTSSAAPHVVGAAALLLQYEPSLSHSQIKQIIRNSAVKDKFTGNVPNSVWGYGKLNIENALRFLIDNSN